MSPKLIAVLMLLLWYVLAIAIGVFLASFGNAIVTWIFVLVAVAFLGPETLKVLRLFRDPRGQ